MELGKKESHTGGAHHALDLAGTGRVLRRSRLGMIDDFVTSLGEWSNIVGIMMIFTMMILITVDVVLRYTLGAPILGSVEIVELLLVIAVFWGLSHTQGSGENISAPALVNMLPIRLQALIDVFTGTLVLGVTAAMAYALVERSLKPGAMKITTDMLEIYFWPFKLLAAFGVALLLLRLVVDLIDNVLIVILGRKDEE